MPQQVKQQTIDKGKYLELRVARLLFAQGLSPFVNVYFHTGLEPHSVTTPDVDVMGCSFLPDATIFFAHYDCKSGDSEVISRILKLMGLRNRIPSGPITYIRKQTTLDIKRYALQYGIRICNVSELNKREKELVLPIFGDVFPSISDTYVYELWQSSKNKTNKQLGRILKYFDFEFWAEEAFTRLRRTIAATELIQTACLEIGIVGNDQDLLVACVIRRFLYGLLAAASQVAFLSDPELTQVVSEWLITEKLPVHEYQMIVESAVQLTFEIYGDPNKGPIRQQDYYIPPPEYTEELVSLLRRSIELYDILPLVLPAFDSFVIEDSLLKRKSIAQALLRGATQTQIDKAKIWLRSIQLFLGSRQQLLHNWKGWASIS